MWAARFKTPTFKGLGGGPGLNELTLKKAQPPAAQR
tara:strand:+ start:568 stop:675 length:108 start_codon:yes stop_codon:yes gene_type:complete